MIVRSLKIGARVYPCVGPYERHEAWTEKGVDGKCVYVVAKHRYRGLAMGVGRKKGVGETGGEQPKKKMNVHNG